MKGQKKSDIKFESSGEMKKVKEMEKDWRKCNNKVQN